MKSYDLIETPKVCFVTGESALLLGWRWGIQSLQSLGLWRRSWNTGGNRLLDTNRGEAQSYCGPSQQGYESVICTKMKTRDFCHFARNEKETSHFLISYALKQKHNGNWLVLVFFLLLVRPHVGHVAQTHPLPVSHPHAVNADCSEGIFHSS